ncbi:MAG: hypothetical protein PHQ43_16030 [Dehalococcoidales bacterium]|nr:hypothetical protein [Dehalococcoidales bacterium]
MKKSAWITAAAFLILAVAFTGCSSPAVPPAGVTITGMVEVIGAVTPDRTDEQRLTYEITLENNGTEPVYVDYIQPTLNDAIVDRVLDEDLKVNVDSAIEPDGYLTIEDAFRFDASGLSKQDIEAIGHLITNIRVSTINVLDLPGRGVR